ncbi:MAG: hypothetical protein M0D54_16515 [Hyphomonadaceae bacterium JAD_PAG50586_4]|nr:MAG: hypothetical protein M0D54_16515 [Hyphomonadaceae bacterium JAD_PAG50586_4]
MSMPERVDGSGRQAYLSCMTDTPSARFRARILEVFPAHAAEQGWTDAAFKAAAAEAELSEGRRRWHARAGRSICSTPSPTGLIKPCWSGSMSSTWTP